MEKKELGKRAKGFVGGILAGVIICFVFFVIDIAIFINQYLEMNYINAGLLVSAVLFLGFFKINCSKISLLKIT